MAATPRAVPGKRYHRHLQPTNEAAQSPASGFGFDLRVLVNAVHQHMFSDRLLVVLKPWGLTEPRQQVQDTATGCTGSYAVRRSCGIIRRDEATRSIICQVAFQYVHVTTSRCAASQVSILLAVFAGSAGQAITFTVVIAVAASTVPVAPVNQRTCLWYIPLQLPDTPGLFRFRFDVRAVLRQQISPVFKPRAFSLVFRVVLQGAAAEMTVIAVVRCGLRGSGTGLATITVEGDSRGR